MYCANLYKFIVLWSILKFYHTFLHTIDVTCLKKITYVHKLFGQPSYFTSMLWSDRAVEFLSLTRFKIQQHKTSTCNIYTYGLFNLKLELPSGFYPSICLFCF
jgi:hypothetical protein